jgi:hypothetical protein
MVLEISVSPPQPFSQRWLLAHISGGGRSAEKV